ncbi:MAG: hypothetical protein JWM78_1658 [Verrucomicrobiaceae bacterium]|nr:hypothetical protein [Verrucomicrobiaceae bacterium]
MAKKQARVLRDDVGNGVAFAVGQVVEGSAKLIKELEASGAVDSADDAVAYALEQGGKVITLDTVVEEPPKDPPVT